MSAAATITLTVALSLSGDVRDPAQARSTAAALIAALPADMHQRVGRGAVLLTTLRQRPDVVRALIASGELEPWPTLAALADAGATTDELLGLLPAA